MCHLSTSSSRVSVWALELNARCIAHVGMEVRDQEFVNQCDAVDPVLNDRAVHELQEYMDLIDASEPDHAALSTCHLLAQIVGTTGSLRDVAGFPLSAACGDRVRTSSS